MNQILVVTQSIVTRKSLFSWWQWRKITALPKYSKGDGCHHYHKIRHII